ncbi:MFS transporter [bacterium]|nr:MFS transporter [bacterium]
MSFICNMFRALRHRNYAIFCAGQMISLIGNWMQTMAMSWLIFRLTGSSTQLGAVTFCAQIPILLFVSWGGIVADRYPKRTVLLWTQSLFMLLTGALAALTLSGDAALWHIYLISLLTGLVTAIDMPARQAFIVHMVEGHNDLSNAIILNSTMVNGARLIGPSIAGILVAWLGEGHCFLLNSLSYLAVLTSLINITVTGFAPSSNKENPLQSLIKGYEFAIKNQPIASLMLAVATMSLNASAHTVLMPIFAANVLHGDSKTMGLLLGTEGIGAITGALILACRRSPKGLEKIIATASILCGVLLVLLSFTNSTRIAILCLIPLGMTILGQLSTSNTLVQYLTPDYLRGRVMGLHAMMFMGLHPIGAFCYGFLADKVGTPTALSVSGVMMLFGSLRFALTLRSFRIHARRLLSLTERCNLAMRH